ncbi:accessory gland protein Acp29AB-like [Drosophila biarmipes]|uniref:accessory gland protein Acp29AB-like n=1 Tax=Drosophila biarmipes TaxID=125945 RepID=UPI0007E7642C|nr:accessory gland protein Acp29AB-like [Drosophila biarmipes]
MLQRAIIVLFVLITRDRIGSLAGTPEDSSPVSQSEDLETHCNVHFFTKMRAVMDYVAANDTSTDQKQVNTELSGLHASVRKISDEFGERLDRLDSELEVIKEILAKNETSLEPGAGSTEQAPPAKFELIGSRYFYYERNITLNWYGAAHACREMGGHLATFKDKEEMLLVQAKVSLSSPVWLGINCLSKKYNQMSLASGKPARFFSWLPNEPIINNDSQRCVALDERYQMAYRTCHNVNRNFICRADDEF